MTKRIPLLKPREKTHRLSAFISGGLIGIGLIIMQDFISLGKYDIPEFTSVLAFAVAIPLLSGNIFFIQVVLAEQHWFSSVWYGILNNCAIVGLCCAMVGVVSAFWHISWIAGSLFLVVGLVYVIFLSIYLSQVDNEFPQEETTE